MAWNYFSGDSGEKGTSEKLKKSESARRTVPVPTPSGSKTRRYLNYEIDSIPDFLEDHRLLDKDLSGRLQEHCRKWTTVVNGLQVAEELDARWWLRYRYIPKEGRVHIGFFGSLLDDADSSILQGVRRLFEGFGLRLHDASPERLKWWQNAGGFQHAYSVEQKDELITSLNKFEGFANVNYESKLHYLVDPWWGPGGTFVQPFDCMLASRSPVEFGICLVPCRVNEQERVFWEGFSASAKTASIASTDHFDVSLKSKESSDPNAEWLSRIYSANLRRLDSAFLCSLTVWSDNDSVAYSVAKSIESLVNEEVPFESNVGDENRLYSRASVRALSREEIQYAADCYRNFEFPNIDSPVLKNFYYLFGNSYRATPGKQSKEYAIDALRGALGRLRQMIDPRGATTVFRFPVSVNSGVSGVDVRQRAPDYIPGSRSMSKDAGKDQILVGKFESDGWAVTSKNELCKHALITGFTGSGKTETVLGLIHQLHDGGTPVLAIESAKREYRGLLGVPAFIKCAKPLWVFSVGNETCSPFRLNPFELLPGIRVEQHISRLQTCIEAALPPIGPLASMIGEALVDIYEERGWRLTDAGPEIGETMCLTFPEMTDFARRMGEIPYERNYQAEVLSNVTAAVTGRIKPLTVGGKGLIYRPERRYQPGDIREESVIARIFNRSVVLELEELNLEDKALFVMIVLAFLREYRDRHASKDGSLAHATVVEEAHNVLENVQSNGQSENSAADPRFKAVQAISLMLSEIRALGEGLIVVDQSPEKLAPDAMRNTNLHIAHQLRDSNDREAIARAMIMDEEQRDYLGKLEPGQAALFMTGLQKATFVNVPRYRPPVGADGDPEKGDYLGAGFRIYNDRTVKNYMNDVTNSYRTGPFDSACQECPERGECRSRAAILKATTNPTYLEEFDKLYKDAEKSKQEIFVCWCRVAKRLAQEAFKTDCPSDWQQRCAFIHLWYRHPNTRRVPLRLKT